MSQKTAMQEIMDIVEMDYINGVEISMKVLYKMLSKGLKKEKQQMIDFHIEVMKIGLIEEGDKKWEDAYHPKIKEVAENFFNETFNNVSVNDLPI